MLGINLYVTNKNQKINFTVTLLIAIPLLLLSQLWMISKLFPRFYNEIVNGGKVLLMHLIVSRKNNQNAEVRLNKQQWSVLSWLYQVLFRYCNLNWNYWQKSSSTSNNKVNFFQHVYINRRGFLSFICQFQRTNLIESSKSRIA